MTSHALIKAALAQGRKSLSEADAKRVLADAGIPVPRSEVARDEAHARAVAQSMRGRLVVKVVSPEILHKSDVGGVRIGLDGADAVATAIRDMAELPGIKGRKLEGWLVEEMGPQGQEIVIGAVRDPQFGPMVMVGLGGVLVEVLKDVAFRLCPITADDAREMIASLKGSAILGGVRGQAALDTEALVGALVKIGGADGVMMREPAIAELDINPLLLGQTGLMAVDARVILAEPRSTAARTPRTPTETLAHFKPLFEPRTVAVLGASTKGTPALPNTFMRRLKAFGYSGAIYPIHPSATEIDGFAAYPSLGATPEPIDYAFVAIGAERIPAALAEARGRVRFAQVISSGFAEVEGGAALEEKLIASAREAGVRVIGPNCLGTYSPRGRLTFAEGASSETGTIGLLSQSGGLTTNMIKRGQIKGIRFSGAVTAGNCADVGPAELIGYFLADPQTKAIGCYIEDVKDGRALLDLMRTAATPKPLVLLRGGRSAQGRMAAASHTGALAGDGKAWEAFVAQTTSVEVATLDEFLDTLLALQELDLRPDRPTKRVVMFGNGGGSSVLGADFMAGLGLDVSPFAPEVRAKLETLDLLPGSSVANPIDTPVATLQQDGGRVAKQIIDTIYEMTTPDAIALHLNMSSFTGRGGVDPVDGIFEFVADAMTRNPGVAHVMMAFRTDGDPALEERKRTYRDTARRMRVPLFDEIPELAKALAAVAHLERQLGKHGRERSGA